MANGRSWTGIGIGVGVAALGGGLLWYLTRSGKASASPFTTQPPPPAPPRPDQVNLQPMGGPPLPPNKPGVLTLNINGDAVALDGRPATPDQVVEAAKAQSGVVEVHLYLASKPLWQSLKERFEKAGVKWNTVSVVSVGGLVRAGSGGRGVYG